MGGRGATLEAPSSAFRTSASPNSCGQEARARRNRRVTDARHGSPVPFRDLVSRHAMRQAELDGITLDEMEETYLDPDLIRPSAHDKLREVRTRWFGEAAIEVVVDTIDGRVVTTWRKRQAR
jgi:hypothetical protein